MTVKQTILIALLTTMSFSLFGQGQFSGDLQLTTEFFMRDSAIGAAGTPHYDNYLTGGESWMTLNYYNPKYQLDAGVRFDFFMNSNKVNPGIPYSAQGVGAWWVNKTINNIDISAGYLYEQFGNGTTLRAFEDRGLAIDNSIFGVRVKYNINDDYWIKGIGGKQRNRFEFYEPIILGFNAEGYESLGDNVSMTPGASIVNRTMDLDNVNQIVSEINGYDLEDRFKPMYNVYAWNVYNTLNVHDFSWSFEVAGKSNEGIRDLNGKLFNSTGSVFYSALGYSRKGFGIVVEGKRTQNYTLRTSPNEALNNGVINYLTALSRTNSLRLLSRYNANTQELNEMAFQGEIVFKPIKKLDFLLGVSDIRTFDDYKSSATDRDIFRELYLETNWRISKKFKTTFGAQMVNYDRQFYEGKPNPELVETITPFLELTYKLDRKKSFRTELQYLSTEQDAGSWAWGLLEFNLAPKFSVSVSDMWNIDPKVGDDLHYPTVFAAFTQKANRFTAAYVKQTEGIVCTGGVCRFEPAFSGVRFGMSTSF